MNKTGPTINRGSSNQSYSTPKDFIQAVEARFGEIYFDLAASKENTKCPTRWFNEENDSLKQDWTKLGDGNLWLNPPYDKITPWAKKCSESVGCSILFLVPASVGSDWFRNYVEPFAFTFLLSPRLCFDGKNPYPKDCILAVYQRGFTGIKTWRWK